MSSTSQEFDFSISGHDALVIITHYLMRSRRCYYTLTLMRHGESTWIENRFSGWTDHPLSKKGVYEAKEAARAINEKHMRFDIVYVSLLKRAL